MKIIPAILESSWFKNDPPVLIDIGASGEINPKWKAIARYSICIAFDADEREFRITENISSGYKKLLVINRIVTDHKTDTADFFLTASPFCSSLLEPDQEKLKPWLFHSLFKVEKKIKLPAISMETALQQAGISYIDWFKSDTQGTDLRLFTSLAGEVKNGVLAAEFEPGIMDAYKGEDKLYTLMQEMQQADFWLSSMDVKGTQRLKESYLAGPGQFAAKRMIRKSPCWAEVTYLHQPDLTNQRQMLLLYIFSLLERQYGFALEICDAAIGKFNDTIFSDCREAVLHKLKQERLKIPLVILKKQLNKLFAKINA